MDLGEAFFGLLKNVIDRTEVKVTKDDYSIMVDKGNNDESKKDANAKK